MLINNRNEKHTPPCKVHLWPNVNFPSLFHADSHVDTLPLAKRERERLQCKEEKTRKASDEVNKKQNFHQFTFIFQFYK